MDEKELKTSPKQRVFIALIAIIMLGSIIASYAAIIINGNKKTDATSETESSLSEEKIAEFEKALDHWLNESNEKYFKYRRWGMLNRPEILILKPKTYWDYREMLRAKGVVLNQIKPVTVINSEERKDFFFSHVETENSSTLDEWKASKE